MTLTVYATTQEFEPSYEQYCRVLACLDPATQSQVQAFNFPGPLLKFLDSVKELATELVEQAQIGWTDLVTALAHRSIFEFLKAIKFNLVLLLKGLVGLTKLIPLGLHALTDELMHTSIIKSLQAGTLKVDEFLDKYPVVKKLAGPVLAAFLFWVWLNMSFVGNVGTDFDMTSIGMALLGRYSVTDLFASQAGLETLALLASGMMGFGVAWLGSSLLNVLVGLAYTGAKHASKSQTVQKLKPLLDLKKV